MLIIDDDPSIRRLIRFLLEEDGYRVIEAEDGRIALQHPEFASTDLVITDLVMPQQEGIETIRKIRRDHPSKKILAVSGYSGTQYLQTARLLGANAILEKPFQHADLMKAVKSLLPD